MKVLIPLLLLFSATAFALDCSYTGGLVMKRNGQKLVTTYTPKVLEGLMNVTVEKTATMISLWSYIGGTINHYGHRNCDSDQERAGFDCFLVNGGFPYQGEYLAFSSSPVETKLTLVMDLNTPGGAIQEDHYTCSTKKKLK